MRLILALLAAGSLLLSAAAVHANTIVFGAPSFTGTCSLSGNSADRSCTHTASGGGGTSVNIRGQASADHGLTTNGTAIADITVSYSVPYTITRDVSFTPSAGPLAWDANVPIQTITFDVNYSGRTAADNSQTIGGLGNAVAYGSSTTGSFGISVGLGGSSAIGSGSNPFNNFGSDAFATTVNLSGGPIIEVTGAGDIPTDYREWTDDVPTRAQYGTLGSVTQSFSSSLTLSFRLRAESRPSGSISTTGGEAIACAGQTSPLGAFDIDNGLDCGSGLTVSAGILQSGTSVFQVPEPGTLALISTGLLGIGLFGSRRLRS